MLRVENLSVAFRHDGVESRPVRHVSFSIQPGERVALVGESGCGKSLTALSLTRLSPTDRAIVSGQVSFEGVDLLAAPSAALRSIRGHSIAYVFQDPSASLNPVMRIGRQIAECLAGEPAARQRAATIDLLARTGLPDPERAARSYPCELSGGQQQRAMLAMALAAHPKLLIADEPTTALDVTTQRQVLDLIASLADATGMALLLITHNLGLVAGRLEKVNVMYAGQIIESGSVAEVLAHPAHPYTRGLLAAVPRLASPVGAPLHDIPGTVPPPEAWPAGCGFAPRCPFARPDCSGAMPELTEISPRHFSRCPLKESPHES